MTETFTPAIMDKLKHRSSDMELLPQLESELVMLKKKCYELKKSAELVSHEQTKNSIISGLVTIFETFDRIQERIRWRG